MALQIDTSGVSPPPISYNLLSFDGGGVKGISSVIILGKMMDKIREIENETATKNNVPPDPDERRPVDYFDLAAGTSTGGLIALMLFRLDMKSSEVVEQYRQLAAEVFSPKLAGISLNKLGPLGHLISDIWLKIKAFTGQSQFSHRPLEKAIDEVVGSFPLDDDDRVRKGDAVLIKPGRGKMFMCATLADKGESILLRNYDPPYPPAPVSAGASNLDYNAISIKEAARATSAAPTYLKEVNIQDLCFWDGGVLNNNPINQVWDNRYDLVGKMDPHPRIKCVVSLGTTRPEYSSAGTTKRRLNRGIRRFFNTVSQTVAFVTNTEAKHRDFERNVRQHNQRMPTRDVQYYRFNATTGHEQIDLDDYLGIPKLVDYTNVYLQGKDVEVWIDECAGLLAKTL